MSQTGLAFAPPGTTPPYVLAYNASTVPVLQLAMSSDDLSEAMIFDLGQQRPAHGARHGPRGHDALAVRRPAAAGSDRPRPRRPTGTRSVRQRRDRCDRRAESDPARRRTEDRRPRVLRGAQRQSQADRGFEQRPGHDPQRHRDLRARRRARARRLSAADQHRAPRRPPRRPAEHPQDRERLDARHHPRHQGASAAYSRRASALLQNRRDRRSVDLRPRAPSTASCAKP